MSAAAFSGFQAADLPAGWSLYKGKVRDVLDAGTHLVLCATDRISAFDRVLGTLPQKGAWLTQMSLHWFERTKDLVPNQVLKALSPRSVAVKKAQVIPVEVIVRGYLTGSLWRAYQAGGGWPGVSLPSGMRASQSFAVPLLTPSTKAAVGEHDEPISETELVASGRVSAGVWEQVRAYALALFARGQADLAAQGLLLVDTKYEFGVLPDGQVILIDEVHTPDSSRFWYADDYEAAFAAGREPAKLDKEYLRQWLLKQGWSGEGPVPAIPGEVWDETAARYLEAFRRITGREFSESAGTFEAERALVTSFRL